MVCISTGISGLVAEYIVAIDVTRARFPADAYEQVSRVFAPTRVENKVLTVLQDPRMSCAFKVRKSFWETQTLRTRA